MAKRIKQVMDASSVAHYWAHQTQDHARTATSNFYYHGPSIYSYGSHFQVAELMDIPSHLQPEILAAFNDAGGDYPPYTLQMVLFNPKHHSNTTTSHQNAVKGAASHLPILESKVFVDDLRPDKLDDYGIIHWNRQHNTNIEYFRENAEEAKGKAERARDQHMIRYHSGTLHREVRKALCYLKVYGLFDKPEWAECRAIFEKLAEYERVAKPADPATEEKREKARASREKAKLKEAEKLKTEWLTGESEDLTEWYGWKNKQSRLKKIEDAFGTLLRMADDEIQTTKSVRVPVADAIKLLRYVRLVKETGKDLSKILGSGSIMVGHYQVNRITADGDLIVGCHHIKNTEIERLAHEQGWDGDVTVEKLMA